MLKTLITLARGHSAAAAESITDRNALVILDQQIRDGAAAVEKARRALALAMAQDQGEAARQANMEKQFADLESRTIAALGAGDEISAREGAETMAGLENDLAALKSARALFAREIARLKEHVSRGQQRLDALDRGRRIARAAESVRGMRQGRIEEASLNRATIAEAEATLSRLRDRQTEVDAAEAALDAMDRETSPAGVAERMAAQGYGAPVKTSADAMLERLRGRSSTAA